MKTKTRMATEIIAEFENKLDRKDRESFVNYLIGSLSGKLTDEQILDSAKLAYRMTLAYATKEGKL